METGSATRGNERNVSMMTETEWFIFICTLAIIAFICIAMWIIRGAINDLQLELLWFISEKDNEKNEID